MDRHQHPLVIPADRVSPRLASLLLQAAGWTQARIGAEVGLSASAVSYGLHTGSSPKLRAWVSQFLEIPEPVIWPDRFPSRYPSNMPIEDSPAPESKEARMDP